MTDASGKTGRKFLVVVDGTPECRVALRFASRRAMHTGGGVTMLCVLEPGEFQHWLGVETIMKEEARAEAEAILHELAAEVNATAGLTPELLIREGKPGEEILKLIKEDPMLSILVLGMSSENEAPGPLVAIASGISGTPFPLPVTLVPGDLSDEQIESLA